MYLGIDLGTSGVKVLLMDENQRVLGSATGALTVSRPHAGWAEQAPADWIAATRAALNELRASHDLSGVKGIGLSGQMHGAVTLDADDQVIRPAILWNDTRSHVQAARLDAMPEGASDHSRSRRCSGGYSRRSEMCRFVEHAR